MEHKLKAISNNVDNDTIDLILRQQTNDNHSANKWDSKDTHICQKTVPVLFSTLNGIHLRKFNKSSSNKYSITFCDLERWNFRKNHVDSIGLTPPSTSDKSTTAHTFRLVQAKHDEREENYS